MSERKPLKILLVTPLDLDKMPNNSEHDHARHDTDLGHQVSILYKVMNRSSRLRDMVADTCTLRIRCQDEPTGYRVAVDPFFNYFAGIRRDAEDRTSPEQSKKSLRYYLICLLSPLAIFRDVFATPCFLIAAWLKLKGRYDVCIGFGPWGALVGWVLRKTGKVRCLVYQDRDYEPGLMASRVRRAYTAAVERFAIRRADLVVSIGHLLAELRREQTGCTVHVIPVGVDLDRFTGIRRESEIQPTLIYVGNLISWSGLDQTIRAMPAVRRACPSAQLWIVGDGLAGYKNGLRKLVEDLSLDDCVTFHGQVPREELPALLGAATVGLANSEPVSFRKYARPLKVIEYMAAGLPVIATEGTEAARMLEEGDSGVCIPYEIDAIADAAIALFSDPQRCAQLRENGLRQSGAMAWDTLLNQELDLIETHMTQCNTP